MEYLHHQLTDRIASCFFDVYNALGHGFLEKVYERAMIIELGVNRISARSQQPIDVWYRGILVGQYFADIVVADKVIIEVKAAESIASEHECQLINYLKASNIEVGLLLNFGKKPGIRRKIFTNDRKTFGDGTEPH